MAEGELEAAVMRCQGLDADYTKDFGPALDHVAVLRMLAKVISKQISFVLETLPV